MAAVMLDKEKEEKKQEREATLSDRVPPLQLSGLSLQDLQVWAGHCMSRPSYYNETTWFKCPIRKNPSDAIQSFIQHVHMQ